MDPPLIRLPQYTHPRKIQKTDFSSNCHTYSIPSNEVDKLKQQRNSTPYFSENRKIQLCIESAVLSPAVNLQPCTRTALHSSSLLMSKKTAGRFPNLPLFFKNPDPGIFCLKLSLLPRTRYSPL